MVAMFFVWDNFCRVHHTLPMTPRVGETASRLEGSDSLPTVGGLAGYDRAGDTTEL